MDKAIVDEVTLDALKAMLGANIPECVQRFVAGLKALTDRVGSGAPMTAQMLAMACMVCANDNGNAPPFKAQETEPSDAEPQADSPYLDMSKDTLAMLVQEKGLTVPKGAGKAQLVAALLEADKEKVS